MCGLVRRRGLEPLCLAALAPQASASANFATSARVLLLMLRISKNYNCGDQSETQYSISWRLNEMAQVDIAEGFRGFTQTGYCDGLNRRLL